MTLLYEIAFLTYGEPNPERLGTAERAVGKMRVWAVNGDDAVTLAKKIAAIKHVEWLGMISTDAVTGVILEQILNDPLNGYDFMEQLTQPPTEAPQPLVLVDN